MAGAQPPGGAARGWPLAVFLGMPIVLVAIWLLRTPPPPLDDCAAVAKGFLRSHDAWLSGARLIFRLAALLVMAAILRVSAWRRGGRATPATIAVCTTFAGYVVAAAIETDLFFLFGLVYLFLATAWFLSVPWLIVGIAVYLRLQTRPARPLAPRGPTWFHVRRVSSKPHRAPAGTSMTRSDPPNTPSATVSATTLTPSPTTPARPSTPTATVSSR